MQHHWELGHRNGVSIPFCCLTSRLNCCKQSFFLYCLAVLLKKSCRLAFSFPFFFFISLLNKLCFIAYTVYPSFALLFQQWIVEFSPALLLKKNDAGKVLAWYHEWGSMACSESEKMIRFLWFSGAINFTCFPAIFSNVMLLHCNLACWK